MATTKWEAAREGAQQVLDACDAALSEYRSGQRLHGERSHRDRVAGTAVLRTDRAAAEVCRVAGAALTQPSHGPVSLPDVAAVLVRLDEARRDVVRAAFHYTVGASCYACNAVATGWSPAQWNGTLATWWRACDRHREGDATDAPLPAPEFVEVQP